jgi:predicted nucleic acid-binding protein
VAYTPETQSCVILKYVLDTGALIAAERGKQRARRFFALAASGYASLIVPYPVIAEWWRGRSDVRMDLLAATRVVASIDAAKAAGVALNHQRGKGAQLTVDAIVMATAALADAIVVTQDPEDFETLGVHFPQVAVISV